MKHIKNLADWFVHDIMDCNEDNDLLELQMMEDMYLCWLDISEFNNNIQTVIKDNEQN